MFADAKDIEADLIGELDFFEQLTDAAGGAVRAGVKGVKSCFHKTVDTDLHLG
jgi:hypothetical protein